MMDAELQGQIERALAELRPSLRTAIVLTGLQGMDVAEAAQVEGCSRATMYWRVHKARKQLRLRLNRYLSL